MANSWWLPILAPDDPKAGLVHTEKIFYHLFILHAALHDHCRSSGQQRTHG